MIVRVLFLFFFCLGIVEAGLLPESSSNISSKDASLVEQSGDSTFLKPEQAFKLSIQTKDATTLFADFDVAPGYYLYRQRIKLSLDPNATSKIESMDYPTGEMKHDPNFGDMEVYHQPFRVTLHLKHPEKAPQQLALLASFQGCSEKGLCYAPLHKHFEISLTPSPVTEKTSSGSESDQIHQILGSGKLWLIALGFFGFGLLLSLTPCVFPMIPILSGIIVGQGAHPSRWHAFNLSLTYVLGMAITYALAGIAAGLSGQLISNALQNPWALGLGAVIFVVLALSMFGFYELKLPSGLESQLAERSNHFKGGKFTGVFAMGALSALIVSPCVAAPLAGALIYISQTHDVVLGGLALFMLALGMGVPLLAVGLSAGALLPRSGPWMNTVRHFFGVVMLGMAIWIIAPVIPISIQMGLWAALLIGSAIFLNALDALPHHASHLQKLGKGLGIIGLVTGVALLVGAYAGSTDPLRPLAGLTAGKSAGNASESLPFHQVKNVAELESQIKNAQGRYVMLDFYADWCVSCKEYDQYTFSDPRVRKLLENTSLLRADVTQNSSDDSALLAKFGLFGPPGIVFFDAEGKELTSLKVVGYQNAEQFLVTLNNVFSAKNGHCPKPLEC